jgi:hypothetical protein
LFSKSMAIIHPCLLSKHREECKINIYFRGQEKRFLKFHQAIK